MTLVSVTIRLIYNDVQCLSCVKFDRLPQPIENKWLFII